jgi:hypothetical protein
MGCRFAVEEPALRSRLGKVPRSLNPTCGIARWCRAKFASSGENETEHQPPPCVTLCHGGSAFD